MAVYNITGESLNNVYDVDGISLSQAYDISGNPLITAPQPITVMSYNVQWFTGINSQTVMQQKIINDNKPSIIGMQELSQNGSIPTVGNTVLSEYGTKILSNHKNYLGIASKLRLYDTVVADFVNQDPEDISRYGETRAYMKTYFDFNGKKVCLINTHLAVITASYIYAQMNEVFSLAEGEDYVIITGDFNTWFSAFTSDVYENTFKQFVDAGYKMVNNSPNSGITNTYSNLTDVTSLSDMRSNPDSIIVSGNIGIDARVFDTTKFSYLNGDVIDHIPVVATLLI